MLAGNASVYPTTFHVFGLQKGSSKGSLSPISGNWGDISITGGFYEENSSFNASVSVMLLFLIFPPIQML
jgi:hypothetical protein